MGVGVLVAVAGWLVVLAGYDIWQRRLPNRLTVPGAVVIIAVAVAAGRGTPALAGAVALSLPYLVVHLVAPSAMGGGDVKLAVGVGAVTGAFGFGVWALAALGAPLITAVWALLAVVRRSAATVPHGPSMGIATIAALVVAAVG
jgi:leader peptidase (prepilin peptidase)/N-methyltransferase